MKDLLRFFALERPYHGKPITRRGINVKRYYLKRGQGCSFPRQRGPKGLSRGETNDLSLRSLGSVTFVRLPELS
jgi:hypothetical protein